MDLVKMGRSLGELGRTLRWSDIKALLLHLPADAHVRKVAAQFDAPQQGEQAKAKTRAAPSRADRDAKAREAAARIRAGL